MKKIVLILMLVMSFNLSAMSREEFLGVLLEWVESIEYVTQYQKTELMNTEAEKKIRDEMVACAYKQLEQIQKTALGAGELTNGMRRILAVEVREIIRKNEVNGFVFGLLYGDAE